MQSPDEPVEYWVEGAFIGFEEDLDRLMNKSGMSRADLAREYGASTAFISKALNNPTNFTLKTLAKLGRGVRGILQVRLIHEDDEVVRVLTLDQTKMLEEIEEDLQGERRPHRRAESGPVPDGRGDAEAKVFQFPSPVTHRFSVESDSKGVASG